MARAVLKQPDTPADILKKISGNIQARLKANDTSNNPKFKDIASSNDGNVGRILKDFYKVSNIKNKALTNAVGKANQETSKKLDTTNTLLQRSISVQEEIIKELQNFGSSMKQNNINQTSSNFSISRSLGDLGKQFKYGTTAAGRKGLGGIFGKSLGGKLGFGLGVAGVAGLGAAGAYALGSALKSHHNAIMPPIRNEAGETAIDKAFPRSSGNNGNNGGGSNVSTGALKEVNTNQLAFIRGIGSTESSFNRKEAYSETLNQAHNNANVRKYGQDGADYGYYQNNQLDVNDAIKIGVPPEIAIHLHGGGQGGSSSVEEQTHAMHEYLKRKYPKEYEALKSGNASDFENMRQKTQGKWFGLKDNPDKARKEFEKGGKGLAEIFPEIPSKSKTASSGLTDAQSEAQAKKFGGHLQPLDPDEKGNDATQLNKNDTGGNLHQVISSSELSGTVGGQSASRGRGGHQGLDMFAPSGSDVYSPADGKVEKIGSDNFGKPTLTIKHDDGTYTRFLHMKENHFSVGDKVSGGQVVGTSGEANGVEHLHVERWDKFPNNSGDGLRNPRKDFNLGNTEGKLDNPTIGGSLVNGEDNDKPIALQQRGIAQIAGSRKLNKPEPSAELVPKSPNVDSIIETSEDNKPKETSSAELVPNNPTVGKNIDEQSKANAERFGGRYQEDDKDKPAPAESTPENSSSNQVNKEEASFFSDDDDWLKKLGFSGGYYPEQTKGIA